MNMNFPFFFQNLSLMCFSFCELSHDAHEMKIFQISELIFENDDGKKYSKLKKKKIIMKNL